MVQMSLFDPPNRSLKVTAHFEEDGYALRDVGLLARYELCCVAQARLARLAAQMKAWNLGRLVLGCIEADLRQRYELCCVG